MSITLFKIFIFLVGMCVCLSVHVCIHTWSARSNQNRASDPLKWECQEVLGMLQTQPWSSREAARSFNHWPISPAPHTSCRHCWIFILMWNVFSMELSHCTIFISFSVFITLLGHNIFDFALHILGLFFFLCDSLFPYSSVGWLYRTCILIHKVFFFFWCALL